MSVIHDEWRPRIHNLLGLAAQYQMEPGSYHSTKESCSPPREGQITGGVGVEAPAWLTEGKGGKEGAMMCQMLQPYPKKNVWKGLMYHRAAWNFA